MSRVCFGIKPGISKAKTPQEIKRIAKRVEHWNSDTEYVRMARELAQETERMAVNHLKLRMSEWPELEVEEGEVEEKDLSTQLKALAARIHLGTATDADYMSAAYRAGKLLKETEFTTLKDAAEECGATPQPDEDDASVDN